MLKYVYIKHLVSTWLRSVFYDLVRYIWGGFLHSFAAVTSNYRQYNFKQPRTSVWSLRRKILMRYLLAIVFSRTSAESRQCFLVDVTPPTRQLMFRFLFS